MLECFTTKPLFLPLWSNKQSFHLKETFQSLHDKGFGSSITYAEVSIECFPLSGPEDIDILHLSNIKNM